jgi:hypothetical protein
MPKRFAAAISCAAPGAMASEVKPSPMIERLLKPVRLIQVRPLSSDA